MKIFTEKIPSPRMHGCGARIDRPPRLRLVFGRCMTAPQGCSFKGDFSGLIGNPVRSGSGPAAVRPADVFSPARPLVTGRPEKTGRAGRPAVCTPPPSEISGRGGFGIAYPASPATGFCRTGRRKKTGLPPQLQVVGGFFFIFYIIMKKCRMFSPLCRSACAAG